MANQRLSLELVGPRLVLEYRLGSHGALWFVVNAGDADAIDVECDVLRSGNASAILSRIHRVPRGGEVQAVFEEALNGRNMGRRPHPRQLVNAMTAEIRATFDSPNGADFVHAIADLTFPVRLTYCDATGAGFESTGRMHWNAILHRWYSTPLSWGPRKRLSPWRRVMARLKAPAWLRHVRIVR